jgi:hypothetical protein
MVFLFFAQESKDLSKEQLIVIQELVTAYNQFAKRTHVIPNLDQLRKVKSRILQKLEPSGTVLLTIRTRSKMLSPNI